MPITRRFKSPHWDVPPAGYENLTPKEYKALQASGKVPHSVVNPSSQILQGTKYAHPNPLDAAKAAAAIITQQILGKSDSALSRQARRLYVGNIPPNMNQADLIGFFQDNHPGIGVISCQMNMEKNFAFVEFATVDDTNNAIGLDGASLRGQPLRIRRPHDYQSTDGSQAKKPLAPRVPGGPKVATKPPVAIQVPGMQGITPTTTPRVLTEVLCLMNMVDPDELMDDEEYQDILEDIREECSKFGTVRSIEIPRPYANLEPEPPGLGKVFVEFDSPTEAQRAQLNLAGRRFSNRIVVSSYFDRDRYRNKEF